MKKTEVYKKYDETEIESTKRVISNLQDNGLYPHKFNMPLLLQLELTSKCNLHCKHCYNDSNNQKSQQDEMSVEKWISFCKYIVNNGGVFECVISGGEPLLLGDDLYKIMDILHDDGTTFLLITNGYLLNEKTVKRLAKYRYKWIQVSIDGVNAEYHDSFRERKGSWERAVKGAFLVTKAGLPLTIAHSVSALNICDVDKMCELAYQLGAGSIILGEIIPSGRAFFNERYLLDDEQREQLYEMVEKNSEKYKGRMIVQRSANTKFQLQKYQSSPTSGVVIRPNGSIRLDCMMPFTIGNVLTDDFCNVWKSKAINCWHTEKAISYIENLEQNRLKNYVDADIEL